MRKNQAKNGRNEYSILALDDDKIMTLTIQAYFQRSGFRVDVETDPYQAIERIRNGHYDILLLDFLMTPICGDQVVEQIRQFNEDLYIILLTGHKSMAPPIKAIRELDIQGYYEKSDRFDQLELLVESCVKSIQQMRAIRNYQKGLSQIVEFLPKIYHLQSTDEIADNILQSLAALTGSGRVSLLLDTDLLPVDSPNRYYIRTLGLELTWENMEVLSEAVQEMQGATFWSRGGLVVLSLTNQDQRHVGCLRLELPGPPEYYQTQLLEVFARQVSSAIGNVCLHMLLEQKNRELEGAYGRLRDSYLEMISAMRLMVDAKDLYTRGHSERVSYYAVKIAKAMGKDGDYCERVRVAGLFHDIGKLGIPDGILLKDGRLTDNEYEQVKKHPADGDRILSALSLFQPIAHIVRAHHERPDGQGYPDGLTGSAIPEEARIIAVADSFDAMTSNRRYRKSMETRQAIQELIDGKNLQFDPAVVDAFLPMLSRLDDMEREIAWTRAEE